MLPKMIFFKKQDKPNKLNKIYPEYEFKLMFDGCSRGNPGLSGAGAVLYHFDKEIWCGSLFVGDTYTNNQAEYAGLILGLKKAKELNLRHLGVEGDSLLIINQMNGLYKCRSTNLVELNEQANNLASHFEKINFNHILRDKNKRADELSNIAVDKYMEDTRKMLII
jgi:ribonuclease HI